MSTPFPNRAPGGTMRRHLVSGLGMVTLASLMNTPIAAQQLDPTADLMKRLTEAPGPSAFEEEVRRIFVAEMDALGAELAFDGLGSVHAELPRGGSGPRVMVTAHLDEVGLMVQHVTSDGFVRVKNLGGFLGHAYPDQRWTILGRDGPVMAISGLPTVHVTPASQRGQVWSVDQVFLDLGATSREEVEAMGVRPGDGVAPWSPFLVMPNGRYAAKGWDDRVGVAVMIAAARRIEAEGIDLPGDVVWVATTQEEIGLRGAQTAVDLAQPDIGISIEAGVSADYPGIRPTQAQERLGGGPGIFLLDSSMIPNRRFRDFFFRVAEEAGIALQPALRHRSTSGEHDRAHPLPPRPHGDHPAVRLRRGGRAPHPSAPQARRGHGARALELRPSLRSRTRRSSR